MILTKTETKQLIGFLIDTLELNTALLYQMSEQQDELILDDAFKIDAGGGLIAQSLDTVSVLKSLLKKPNTPTVSEATTELINFWVERKKNYHKRAKEDVSRYN